MGNTHNHSEPSTTIQDGGLSVVDLLEVMTLVTMMYVHYIPFILMPARYRRESRHLINSTKGYTSCHELHKT